MPTLQPVLLVLVLAPFAGCLSPDGGAAPAAAEGNDALPAAPPPGPGGRAAAPLEAAPPAPALVPFSWDGKVGRWACAPAGPNTCLAPAVPIWEGDPFEATGEAASRATLTLSWTPETPLTEQLRFFLAAAKPCGERCWEFLTLQDLSGPSPLTFADVEVALADGEVLGVYVATTQSDCVHAAPAYGCAQPAEQAFRVEGVLTVPAAASAPSGP